MNAASVVGKTDALITAGDEGGSVEDIILYGDSSVCFTTFSSSSDDCCEAVRCAKISLVINSNVCSALIELAAADADSSRCPHCLVMGGVRR